MFRFIQKSFFSFFQGIHPLIAGQFQPLIIDVILETIKYFVEFAFFAISEQKVCLIIHELRKNQPYKSKKEFLV